VAIRHLERSDGRWCAKIDREPFAGELGLGPVRAGQRITVDQRRGAGRPSLVANRRDRQARRL